jgi:hypothetical protein
MGASARKDEFAVLAQRAGDLLHGLNAGDPPGRRSQASNIFLVSKPCRVQAGR